MRALIEKKTSKFWQYLSSEVDHFSEWESYEYSWENQS